jgi:exopolyphosphatase/guanosine-5'-triphosphate,3'-diphosphate pyrophosphatase
MCLSNQYISVLDIGSNSFHFIVTQIVNNSISVIQRERFVLRLNRFEMSGTNIIDDDNTKLALAIIRKVIKISESYNSKLVIVATSAVRESENGDQFIEFIFAQTGYKIYILNGETEAELIFNAIINSNSDISDQLVCNIDIGGGSTEIIVGNHERILNSISLKIGAVRMSQQFFHNYILTTDAVDKCYDHLYEILNSQINVKLIDSVNHFIGSSGTMLTILDLLKKNSIVQIDEDSFTYQQFLSIRDVILSGKTIEERLCIPGIETRRADILPAGIIIVDSLFKLLKIKKIRVSSSSLREGVVLAVSKGDKKYFAETIL